MPFIEVSRMQGAPSEFCHVEAGTDFYEWLCGQAFNADIKISINGKEINEDDDISIPLTEEDSIIIIDSPKSGGLVKTLLNPLEHLNPIKFTQKIFSSLTPQASVGNSGSTKTSPNNNLKSQTNIARNGEAIPDNFGQVRLFPDLLQQSLVEYINNLKYVTEFMCFGLGEYVISSVRYSESNLGSMAGASYNIYQPDSTIPTLYEPYAFDDVDGQEVPGKNEIDDDTIVIETATTTAVVSGVYAGGQIAMKIIKNSAFDYFVDLTMPHAVTFVINITYPTTSGNVTENVTLFGNLISVVETNNGVLPTPTEYYYTFTMDSINGSKASFITTATINNVIFTINDNEALVVGPFFSPVDSSQLWINTQSALGGNSETNWKMKLWKVDSDNVIIPGTTQEFTYRQTTPHDSTSETFYRTDKITPTGGFGRYAIQFERTDNSSDASILKVESIQSINIRTGVTYPDKTTVIVRVRATENATGSRERKYNALGTRKVISYNYATETVDYTLRASRNFADAVIYNWIVTGGQPVSTIDIHELYTISNSLSDARLGYFDFTFDDEDTSLGERIQTICDAATVTCFWDDGVLSFVRDELKSTPASVLSTRSLATDNYKLSYDMTLPGGYDGVELQYRDPITNKQAFIKYVISGSTISSGEAFKPKKFDMLYIRNEYQARDRALKEVRRLLYSRASMTVTALSDGEWVNVGQMIQVVDMYDTNQQSGYLKARTGNTFETSEPIRFVGTMFVVITDSDGNPTARYPATTRNDGVNGFIAAIPDVSLNIYNGDTVQQPSRYIIATDTELDSTHWLITSKKIGTDGKTALSLSEYNSDMYIYEVPE